MFKILPHLIAGSAKIYIKPLEQLFFSVYFETGTTGNAGELTIETGSGTTGRNWKIKVSYLRCSDIWK
jgi:hypothetical protein